MKFVLLAFTSVLMAFQETPPEGTAASCDNFYSTPASHRCQCAKAMMCDRGHSSEPDKKCSTFCRPGDCHCIGPCSTRK